MKKKKNKQAAPNPSALPPARAVALDCIHDILHNGRDLQASLDDKLRHAPISSRDGALATELVYGYIRLKNRITVLLNQFLKTPDKLPLKVRFALGIAVYEMLYLDKIPAYASVDWCVDFLKKKFSPGLAKLANAVLRSIDRLEGAALSPDYYKERSANETEFLSIWYSCPLWIVEQWIDGYGLETTTQYLEAALQPAPLGVRINQSHADAEEVIDTITATKRCIERIEFGAMFAPGDGPADMDEFSSEGLLTRQSMASQEVLLQASPHTWDAPVWDSCCGRGGKTLALLEAGVPVFAASDLSGRRLKGLKKELKRLKLPTPAIFRASAASPPPFREAPATILADVPCSGLGTLSRRPDARYHRTTEGVAELVSTQAAILENGWQCLAAGGKFVYLTCTINPDENEKQIASFLANHPEATFIKEWRTPADTPYREFFYVAVLQKP